MTIISTIILILNKIKMMKTTHKLAFLFIIIELITYITCNNSTNLTISSNPSISSKTIAHEGAKCQLTADCPNGEGCHDGKCIRLKTKINAFLAAFFGGFFGADWYYLSRGEAKFVIAGLLKFFTLGGFGAWWLADWITVVSNGSYDGYGLPLDSTNF